MHACRDTRIALRSLSRQCNAVVSSLVFDDVTFHATEASLARSKSCSHLLGYVNFLRILIDASSGMLFLFLQLDIHGVDAYMHDLFTEPAADIVTTMLCTLTQARHLQSVTLVLLVHEEESSIASIRSARTFGFIVRHALDQRLPYTICAITSKDDGETLRIHVSTTPEVPRDMLYSITLSRSKYVCSISPWIWYADLHNLVTELAVDNAVLDVISITGLAAVFPNIRHLSLTHSSFIIKLDSFVITWNSLWLVFDRLWTLRSKSTSDCGYVEQASQQGYEEVAIDRILEANKAEYDMNPRGPLKLLASFIEAFANIVREMAQSLASMPDSSGVIYLDVCYPMIDFHVHTRRSND
jgi:hypothetical protein